MDFEDLTQAIAERKDLCINGSLKKINGAAKFASVNMPDGDYIKVAFDDGSGLCLIFEDKSVFYCPQKLGQIETITDQQIGNDESLDYQGKHFKLVNPHDYQFVKNLYCGTVKEIEGEVKFSDYVSDDGDMLSVGWNMYTGKRDDVYAVGISIDTISVPL